jgi:DNA-directed RNA polymerase subunit beta'
MESHDEFTRSTVMANSGARGSTAQIRQLAVCAVSLADPIGQIIEVPIRANFREGLHRFWRSYNLLPGARKGLAELRASYGGLPVTSRAASYNVSQDLIVREIRTATRCAGSAQGHGAFRLKMATSSLRPLKVSR